METACSLDHRIVLADESGEAIKIVDVNIDCLECVFRSFGFKDILNGADSNSHLREAAALVYKRKYAKKELFINLNSFGKLRSFNVDTNTILVNDLKTCFQILRCFGHLIPKLNFDSFEAYTNQIIAYINEYCAESLTKMSLRNCENSIIDTITKPFVNVEDVHINGSCLEGRWVKSIFPRMRYLEFTMLRDEQIQSSAWIMNHFPHLESLDIGINIDDKQLIELFKENLAITFQLNPNLRILRNSSCLDVILDATFLQSVSENLQNLEILSVMWQEAKHFKLANSNDSVIRFKNVKKFGIYFCYLNRLTSVMRLPISFDQLEELTIGLLSEDLQNAFYNFIIDHPTINKLTISPMFKLSWSQIVDALPALTEFHFECGIDALEIRKAINAFGELKSLRNFSFHEGYDESTYVDLLKQLDAEWTIHRDDDTKYVELDRRE